MLYCTFYGHLFYTHANSPKQALKNLRKQMLNEFGKYSIKELKVRETINGVHKWRRIQLTTTLLRQCGILS